MDERGQAARYTWRIAALCIALVITAGGRLPLQAAGEWACNGNAALCDRPYNEAAYATTHNAYSTAEDHFRIPLPNQQYAMRTQLAHGVRGLMLDTYDKDGVPYLCHGACGVWGQRPLVDGLVEIRTFIEANPNEVITFILESYLSEEKTAGAFAEAGLMDYVYAHTDGEPWPTLRTMIESGKRLVVFTDDRNVQLPWHHYVWTYAWETPFSFGDVSQFTCVRNRGRSPNDLFILNHFITGHLGAVRWDAPRINAYERLHGRAAQCWGYEETNPKAHIPNFVTVDHYDLGAVFDVVDALNAAWPKPPEMEF